MRKILVLLIILPLFAFADDYSHERKKMVEVQLRMRNITDKKVLSAMEKVPRHLFVSERLRRYAYTDQPLPIGYGQTISQPYTVAFMTQALKLRPNDRVLEIGTGSGYQAAILSLIVKEVYTVEIIKPLFERGKENLKSYKNVKVKNDDGYYGWKEFSPFDAIIVTCAPDHVPPPLLRQLKDGGRMIVPIGRPGDYQTMTLIVKKGERIITKNLGPFLFVPMIRKGMLR